jgi:hypothetical protein
MATETRQTHASLGEPETSGFDREIGFWGTLWTGVGILLVTIAGMISMWFFSEHLRDSILAKSLPMTAVQEEARAQVEEINRQRLQTERRPFPALEWPLYAAPPPQPRVQVQPWLDMQGFLLDERPILEDYGWVSRNAGLVRVPISRAIDEIATGGMPRELPTPPAEPAPGTSGGEAQRVPQVPQVSSGEVRGPEGR